MMPRMKSAFMIAAAILIATSTARLKPSRYALKPSRYAVAASVEGAATRIS